MNAFDSGYIAFISYRHMELDRAWARWLHRGLETYRLPAAVSREFGLPKRLGKVFRDEDELPAASELKREVEIALQRSQFLIIVCSPRTPESSWINQEATRFIELGRANRILTLLVEGEPANAFPPVLQPFSGVATLASVSDSTLTLGAEPLAADVRPTSGESVSRRRRRARIKIAAALVGVPFDTLYRRDQERRTRRLAVTIAALACTSVVFAALATFAIVQRNLAAQRLVVAEMRLADSLIREGDAHVLNNNVARARPLYAQASSLLQSLSLSTIPADLAFWQAEQVAAAPTFVFQGHGESVTSLAIAPDGRTALAGSDGLIQVLDLTTWTETMKLRGHGDYVDAVAFGPRETQLAVSGGGDGTARVWDLGTGAVVSTFSKHGVGVKAVVFLPDGRSIASAGADGTVRLWDARTGRERHVFESDAGTIWDVEPLPDGTRLVSAANDGTVALWDIDYANPVRLFKGHAGSVNAIDISPDGRTLITGGSDGSVRVWDVETGKAEILVVANEELIFDVAFSPSGRFALTADSAGNVELLDRAAASR